MKPLSACVSRIFVSRRAASFVAGLVVCGLLIAIASGCDLMGQPGGATTAAPTAMPEATAAQAADYPAVLPTATLPATPPATEGGLFTDPDFGLSFNYPKDWQPQPGLNKSTIVYLVSPQQAMALVVIHSDTQPGDTLESVADQVVKGDSQRFTNVQLLGSTAIKLNPSVDAWRDDYQAKSSSTNVHESVVVFQHAGQMLVLVVIYTPDFVVGGDVRTNSIIDSVQLRPPLVYGLPRDETLVMESGESNNERDYDPATGDASKLVFSGLVMFTPQLEVVPDLAESWDISPDAMTYTFHLRANARFHNGRPVTAQDFIYSWERAADPATNSNTVLTYLGDIVGIGDMHSGKAKHISGLKALDDHTLQVRIDAPKPYFLMKLTFSVGSVVDKANVESGPSWYRTPNGTGPYRLVRWDDKAILFDRFAQFYLPPPAIAHVVENLYAGNSLQLYESGAIDIAGVSAFNIDRLRAPDEPLHNDLVENVAMCTSYTIMDVKQPPFDDPKVRQAFAAAIDRQQYIDVVLHGEGLPAHGLYPPALPGFTPDMKGQQYDPALARQLLAASRYGGPGKLPTITYTTNGFGSNVYPQVAALAAMWQQNLGVTIQIENLEPDRAEDEIHAGRHGQLLAFGWCADYPDPENFADALFHTGTESNLGHYSNPTLDALLEKARVETDTTKRLGMYKQAEQIIVDDAPAIFLDYGIGYSLIKPYVKGYVPAPISGVPFTRYLSIDPSQMK